ncbi:MAG: chloride channel protein [Propionicimonas sp.]|nr:chloride channel protein [Propionicimonas sp.]
MRLQWRNPAPGGGRSRWHAALAGCRRLTRAWPDWLRAATAVLLVGLSVGLAATLLTLLLHLVQQLAYGQSEEAFGDNVAHADPLRRVLAPTIGLGLCGLVWWWLRRRPLPQVAGAVGARPRRLPLGRTSLDAVLQIVAVGAGASIGREGAPRQVGGALASTISSLLAVPVGLRNRLVVAGAGAGLAVVYNVPLSGVLFATEVLAGGFGPTTLVVSVLVCAVAVVTSWPVLGLAATYSSPGTDVAWSGLLWAVVAAPLCALVGVLFNLLMRWFGRFRPRPGWRLPLFTAVGGLVVGVGAIWLPALPGNGKGIVQLALVGGGSLVVFLTLVVLNPLATGITYGSGVTGGFLTPALGTGAALGAATALVGEQFGQAWSVAGFALVGAVGVLAVTQRAPWFAVVFGWELARPPIAMAALLLVVAWGAFLSAERLPSGASRTGPELRPSS